MKTQYSSWTRTWPSSWQCAVNNMDDLQILVTLNLVSIMWDIMLFLLLLLVPNMKVVQKLRATAHTSQGPWLCSCDESWFSSKGRINVMVCHNLLQAYPLEMGPTHIVTDPWNIAHNMSCRKSCKMFIHNNSRGLLDLHLLVWSKLGRSPPLWPVNNPKTQWSRAFSLVWNLVPRWILKPMVRKGCTPALWQLFISGNESL